MFNTQNIKFNSYKLVCVFRVYLIHNTNQLCNSYSNKFYKLNNLKKIQDPMLELGRFCVDPNYRDPKIIMTAWSAIRKLVEKNKIKFLFGCSSFIGTSIDRYLDCFKFLKTKYIAPKKYNLYNFEKAKTFLNTCFKNGLNSVIFSSTASVYGKSKKQKYIEVGPKRPSNPYAKSK